MLGHDPFYNAAFKNYTTVFGSVFNDISIVRTDINGQTKTIMVPIAFVSKDRMVQRVIDNPDLNIDWKMVLPRMAFEMGDANYAAERKHNSTNYTTFDATSTDVNVLYSPAPYNIPYTLTIRTYYYEDGLQIIEQIIPFFQPEFVVRVDHVPSLKLTRDVPIVLESISFTNGNDDSSYDNDKYFDWDLTFTLQGFIDGPIFKKKIIKTVITKLFEMNNSAPFQTSNTTVNPPQSVKSDNWGTVTTLQDD